MSIEELLDQPAPIDAESRDILEAVLSLPTKYRQVVYLHYYEGYARVMKGNMGREEFNAWVEHAAAQRDFTIELLKIAKSEEDRVQHLEALREDLNRL